MSPSEFLEKFDLRSKCDGIAARRVAPTYLEVVDYFHAIEEELRRGRGMSAHLDVVRSQLDRFERVTSFFQLFGSNLRSLSPEERACVSPVVARLAENHLKWAEVQRALEAS